MKNVIGFVRRENSKHYGGTNGKPLDAQTRDGKSIKPNFLEGRFFNSSQDKVQKN